MLWFFESLFPVVWIAFIVYWRIKAGSTKNNRRREIAISSLVRSIIFVAVIVMLSTTRIPLA